MTSADRPAGGIATDGAHSAKCGMTEYRAVDLKTGRELFRRSLGSRTVNIGEFLGVVAAVKYILENEYRPAVIYTDSTTAIAWFCNKKTASKKPVADLFRAECFLKALSARIDTIQVNHWKTDEWGEIPADFGRK
ncbi:reverse transcriptase-like protein [Bacteroides sp.]|uniref:reverse transcriptase-like protein n=1 Tax=Bacteroides sp. TaxID=29523 RepID=UPI003A94AA87